jgi:hypothetical protein
MPLISFKVGDLPLYLKHDFIPLGPGGRLVFVHECIYCNAVFDMPIRCRRAVPRAGKLVRNWATLFAPTSDALIPRETHMEVKWAKYNEPEPWGRPTLPPARLRVRQPTRSRSKQLDDRSSPGGRGRRSRALRGLPAGLETRCQARRG